MNFMNLPMYFENPKFISQAAETKSVKPKNELHALGGGGICNSQLLARSLTSEHGKFFAKCALATLMRCFLKTGGLTHIFSLR
jgi:hypothetical protein